jgi:hypothetical protein
MPTTAVQPTSLEIHGFAPSEIMDDLIPTFAANIEKVFLS